MASIEQQIVNIQQELKMLKTSQTVGQSSSVLVKVGSINESITLSSSVGGYFYIVWKFTATDSICPLITPKIKVYIGSSTTETPVQVQYDRGEVLSTWKDYVGFTDPKVTAFGISPTWETQSSFDGKTFRVVGDVYANCYGVLSSKIMVSEET